MPKNELINQAQPKEIRDAILRLSEDTSPESLHELATFLTERDRHTYLKQEIPRWAAAAFIRRGKPGIKRLGELILKVDGTIYPNAILEAIWLAAHRETEGKLFSSHMPEEFMGTVNSDTAHEASALLNELVQDARVNPELFKILIRFLSERATFGPLLSGQDDQVIVDTVYDAFAAGSFRISNRLIKQFIALLASEEREEEYQLFLTRHPIFLDPLAAEVVPKIRLGSEYITDFVIRKHDNKYLLVELEKPQDRMFTRQDDFSAKFSHAYGQILDFQQWVDQHSEYARSLLPGISSPRGMLVMDMRSKLSQRQQDKLRRFAVNSTSIDVFTFDDLAQNARSLYRSIVRTGEAETVE